MNGVYAINLQYILMKLNICYNQEMMFVNDLGIDRDKHMAFEKMVDAALIRQIGYCIFSKN